MSKPILKLGFVDYFSPIDEFFTDWFSTTYEVIRDDASPDYLIFCDENFGTRNLDYNHRKNIKIFYTGENRRPENYARHHAICFDHSTTDLNYRLPLYVVDDWVYQKKLGYHGIDRNFMQIPYVNPSERMFCSMVVSNPYCNERNNIFDKLSRYKMVNSAGRFRNNVGNVLSQDPTQWHQSKLDYLSRHKFNIAYENGAYPGYVTEKLYQALYARTVPIYWGSPTVSLDFNPKAFICRYDFNSDEEMIEHIKYLDNNDAAYHTMLHSQPVNTKSAFGVFDKMRFINWFSTNVYKGVLNP